MTDPAAAPASPDPGRLPGAGPGRGQLPAAPQGGLRPALAGAAALAVAMGIGRFAFTPVLPMMLQDAGLSIAAGGWLASANYLGYLAGALSAMALRVPPERAMTWGLLLIGVVTLAMGVSQSFAVWMVLRLVAGMASAWVLISVSAWCLGTLAAYQRPFLNSLVFAGVGSGIASAGLLCLVLGELGVLSAGAWIALGLLALGFTALAWPCLARTPPPDAGLPGEQAGAAPVAPQRFIWTTEALRLVACYGVFGFSYIIPATFLPVLAKAALAGSPAFAWSWPIFGLAAAASTLAVAPLVGRWGNRRVWMASHAVMALGVLLPVWWPHLLGILAAALCVGGTFMVITLVALQEARRVAGAHARLLVAGMTSAFAIGQVLGPLTVGAARAGGDADFSPGLIFAALLLAAGALLLRQPPAGDQHSR